MLDRIIVNTKDTEGPLCVLCLPLLLTFNKFSFTTVKIGFSCYFILTDQILLSDCLFLLETLRNICIAIVCLPGCDTINFDIFNTEINLSLINFENEKIFKGKIKGIFYHF